MVKKARKKAQSAIEFMILVGAVILFFVTFLFVIQGNLADKFQEEHRIVIRDVASTVQDELNLAYDAADGYDRSFTLPPRIISLEYNIVLADNVVYVITDDEKYSISLPVPIVAGDVAQGENRVMKDNGVVYVNVEPYCGDGYVKSIGEQCDNGMDCGDDDKTPCVEDDDCAGIGTQTCEPRNGDGCDEYCWLECGDGAVDTEDLGGEADGYWERCDDGDRDSGDGCDLNCYVEDGWTCSGTSPSDCGKVECFDREDNDDDDLCDYDGQCFSIHRLESDQGGEVVPLGETLPGGSNPGCPHPPNCDPQCGTINGTSEG